MISGVQLVTTSSIKSVLHALKKNVWAEASSDTQLTADINPSLQGGKV